MSSSISVVIPVFNGEMTIHRAVGSVVSQLGVDDELIIVDDGSTDDSVGNIDSLLGSKVVVVHQSNQGVAAARNTGVRMAKNDYIAFLDSDDYWLDSALGAFKLMLENNPEASLVSFAHTRNRKSLLAPKPTGAASRFTEVLDFSDFMDLYTRREVVNSSSTCIRKSALRQIGGFPVGETVGEDIYVWIRCAMLGKIVHDYRVLAVVEDCHPSKTKVRAGIPFHYRWFLNEGNQSLMSPAQRKIVTRFLTSRGIRVCAGAAMSGLRSDALSISFMIAKESFAHGIVASVVSLAPRWVLLFLRSIRRARKL